MIENVQKKHVGFIDNMQKTLNAEVPNISITENGAIGLKTTGKSLLDLNFKLSSMRNMNDNDIWTAFLKAYNENPSLALVWLFFARDVRGGCGERNVFRVIFARFSTLNPAMAVKLLTLIPEYGRWDDLVWLFDNTQSLSIKTHIASIIERQMNDDYDAYLQQKPISLLSKWLPSENTSSKETRRVAKDIRTALRLSPKEYRQRISTLRKYLNIVEQKISAQEWDNINYEAVPSKAGMNYRFAFLRHDADRYTKYLESVRNGEKTMNADALFPYEIVHAYMDSHSWRDEVLPYDETLELKWKNLPNMPGGASTLVVVDGSGSMSSRIGNTNITCHDVARSLGLYFAERLRGEFQNCFITFSSTPKLVRFWGVKSLQSKLCILLDQNDCSNTNIEKTFDLILKTAVDNNLHEYEIPANILIVSDMEFDAATRGWEPGVGYTGVDQTLFDSIKEKWAKAGYKLPRLVFWNVCSRTGTIPLSENELGVALVSGFSPMIADMVFSGELDPYKILVDKLLSDRYEAVRKVVLL